MKDIIFMYALLLISIGLILITYFLLQKTKRLSYQNPDKSVRYTTGVISGIVAGIVVIVIDKIVNQVFKSNISPDTSSIYNFILSLTGTLIALIFISSLLIFLVVIIVYKGFSVMLRKR